ncbi:undecaprenyldiphospho-muramoylpentapeptide beta-N-acetylglucosaminyltransferase [bacterium]|nr:undecaprenyldiphospho-muramoylpentapeptide beta-N-acetylglucosaminyltransferase [bacterium]
MNNRQKIILSGGGTAGSVMPLLAIADTLDRKEYDFLWIGTKNGPEREMVKRENIRFLSITSGKFRRYISVKNLIDIFRIIFAFIESIFILIKNKPDLVISAGSYVSVPLVCSAWLMRKPIIIHQMDVRPGLSNKIMAPLASVITVTFKKSKADYNKKTVWIGNPIRSEIRDFHMSAREARQKLGLREKRPVVFIVGGGTGAMFINQLVWESLKELTEFCQIFHITGKNKQQRFKFVNEEYLYYHAQEFINVDGVIKAYAASSIVVSRCGMGALTELSFLGKPSILIPMPDSHQEDNAVVFSEQQAAIVLRQKEINKEIFVNNIKSLLNDVSLRLKLAVNIKKVIRTDTSAKMSALIKDLIR